MIVQSVWMNKQQTKSNPV